MEKVSGITAHDSDLFNLEKKRALNIARNEEFLRHIGILQPSVQCTDDGKVAADNLMSDVINKSHTLQNFLQSEEGIAKNFPSRATELSYIISYLSKPSITSLICCGPSGSGKTLLCKEVLKSVPFPSCYFLCSGYNSIRSFLGDLWSSTFRCLISCIKSENRSHLSQKAPIKFADFVVMLRKLLDNCYQDETAFGSNHYFILLLDQFDDIPECLYGYIEQILQLNQTVHPRLKLILTARSLLNRSSYQTIVWFKPYSEAQTKSILLARFQNFIDSTVNSNILSNINQLQTNTAEPILQWFQSALSFFLVNTLTSAYSLVSTHLQTLSTFIEAIWLAFFQESLNSTIIRVVNHFQSSKPETEAFPTLPTVTELTIISKKIVNIPSNCWTETEILKVFQPRKRRRHASTLRLNTAKNESPEILWCKSASLQLRLLIVAAFLACRNPRSTDDVILLGAKRGRRKKVRAGTDPAVQEQKEQENTDGSLTESKAFTTERVLSIFAQLTKIISPQDSTSLGTISTYNLLKSLVSKRLLAERGSTIEGQQLKYVSFVSRDLVVAVSDSMPKDANFQLKDFLHDSTCLCSDLI